MVSLPPSEGLVFNYNTGLHVGFTRILGWEEIFAEEDNSEVFESEVAKSLMEFDEMFRARLSSRSPL